MIPVVAAHRSSGRLTLIYHDCCCTCVLMISMRTEYVDVRREIYTPIFSCAVCISATFAKRSPPTKVTMASTSLTGGMAGGSCPNRVHYERHHTSRACFFLPLPGLLLGLLIVDGWSQSICSRCDRRAFWGLSDGFLMAHGFRQVRGEFPEFLLMSGVIPRFLTRASSFCFTIPAALSAAAKSAGCLLGSAPAPAAGAAPNSSCRGGCLGWSSLGLSSRLA